MCSTITAPAIYNTTSMSGMIMSTDVKHASHLNTWAWSPQGSGSSPFFYAHKTDMNVAELCNYLEDSLLKLFDGPFHIHVATVVYTHTSLKNCSRKSLTSTVYIQLTLIHIEHA